MDMSTEQDENLKDLEAVQATVETELDSESTESSQSIDHEEMHVEIENSLTIGEILKQAREERNLSLKVISQHTKISTTMLEHLEDNRFNDLPSKAYVIGFVKSYSKTVNLNTNDCLQLLNDAYGISPQQVNPILESLPSRSENESTSTSESTEIPSQYLTIAGVFLALIIVVAIAINSSNQSVQDDKLAIEKSEQIQQINNTPLVNVKPQEVSEQTPLTEKKVIEAKVTITEEVPANEEVKIEEKSTVKKAEEAKVVEKKIVKEEKKIVKEEKKIVKEEKVEIEKEINLRQLTLPLYSKSSDKDLMKHLPKKFMNSTIAGKQNIFINAVDGDTWITYKSDDGPIKKFVLKQGRTLLIRGKLVRIFLGNINVARLFLNNEPLKITSRSGVKSLVFPQESASEFKLPLFIYTKNGKAITSSDYKENL